MKKIISLSVIALFGILSLPAYAQKVIKLSPNQTKMLANNSLWTLNATCNIQGVSQKHTRIKISVLKNSGTINGKNLSSGQSTSLKVKQNSTVSVSAEAGTQIQLINVGSENLEAVCST